MSAAFLSDLVAAAPPPPTGMTSRKIFEDEQVRTIVFGFAAGAIVMIIRAGASDSLRNECGEPDGACTKLPGPATNRFPSA